MLNKGHSSHGETICIRTDRVFDWCIKNGTASFTITDLLFPANTSEIAGVECAITDAACAEIERSQACGDVAKVTLRKQVTFALTFVDANGKPIPITRGSAVITTQTRTRFFDEFVQVCAPVDATVHCEITDVGCRAFLDGSSAVTVEVFLCQSIRAEAEVKVCIEIVDFCVPGVCDKRPEPCVCPPADCFRPHSDLSDSGFPPPFHQDTSGDGGSGDENGKSNDLSNDKSTDNSSGKSTDNSSGKSTDNSSGKSTDNSSGKSTDNSSGKSTDNGSGKSNGSRCSNDSSDSSGSDYSRSHSHCHSRRHSRCDDSSDGSGYSDSSYSDSSYSDSSYSDSSYSDSSGGRSGT